MITIIYLKVEWLLTEEIEWEMRWRVSNTTLIDGDTFPKTFYLQLHYCGIGSALAGESVIRNLALD